MTSELDRDDLFEDTDEETDDLGSASDETAAPPESEDTSSADANSEKRINDLMSKWQKSESERKKLASRLAALDGSPAPAEAPNGAPAAVPEQVQMWIDTAKEAAQERLYQSDPRFKQYGIDRSVISGDTPQQMRDAATRYRKMIDGMESRMRNALMAEYGIEPEQRAAGGAGKPLDFSSMSKDEFEKWVERGKSA